PDITQAILDGRQPSHLTAISSWRTHVCHWPGKINGPCSVLLEPIRTPSPTEIANPTLFAAGAANLANRVRQHCGTVISTDRDITPPRRDVAGLCASLPTLPPRMAAEMAENPRLSWDRGEIRRETDCLLEGTGFELPVPRRLERNFDYPNDLMAHQLDPFRLFCMACHSSEPR